MLLLAVGNTLRRDDGVAARCLALLGESAEWTTRTVQALVPELAEVIAQAEVVVIADADPSTAEAELVSVADGPGPWPLGHQLDAGTLVGLARRLYGFSGPALLLRLPAPDLSYGTGLSAAAATGAEQGARLLRELARRGRPAG